MGATPTLTTKPHPKTDNPPPALPTPPVTD